MLEQPNIDQEGVQNAFFSYGEKKHNVKEKFKKSLVELVVDGTEKFYVSEFFYNMLFKHQTEALQWLLS